MGSIRILFYYMEIIKNELKTLAATGISHSKWFIFFFRIMRFWCYFCLWLRLFFFSIFLFFFSLSFSFSFLSSIIFIRLFTISSIIYSFIIYYYYLYILYCYTHINIYKIYFLYIYFILFLYMVHPCFDCINQSMNLPYLYYYYLYTYIIYKFMKKI